MKRNIVIMMILLSTLIGQVKASKKTADSESYNLLRGIEAVQNEKYDEGYEYFNKEIEENPENGYAYLWLLILDYQKNNYGKAITNANQALKLLPKKDKKQRGLTHWYKGLVYYEMDESKNALAELNEAILLDPNDIDYRNSRGIIYRNNKQYDLSNVDFNKVIEIDVGSPLGYKGLASNFMDQKKWSEAIEKYTYAIKLKNDDAESYAMRAECYAELKNFNEASDDIINALLNKYDTHIYLAEVASKFDNAAYFIFKAKMDMKILQNSESIVLPFFMGVICEQKSQYTLALEYFNKSYTVEPVSLIDYHIASCYYEMGNFNNGIEYINRGLELDSTYTDLKILKSVLLYELGKVDDAMHEADLYVKNNPDFYGGYYRRGFLKDNLNDVDGAIEDYTKAIILEPTYAYSYLGRGDMYARKGDQKQAIADYEKVVELDSVPSEGSCVQFAFLHLGRVEEAKQFMTKVIEKFPDDDGSYYDACCLYARMGEAEMAINFLRQSFEKGFRRFSHITHDDDLDSLRKMESFKALINEYKEKHKQEINKNDNTLAVPVNSEDSLKEEIVNIPFTKRDGVCMVKCKINDLPLHFVFDTGASQVSMSNLEASFMMKNGYLSKSDVMGSANYIDANGDVSEGTVINLRNVNFGGLNIDNVKASVVRNQKAPLLLGQSVFARLGKIEIDNVNKTLKITHKIRIKKSL